MYAQRRSLVRGYQYSVQLEHFQLRTGLCQRTQQPPTRARVHIRRQDQHELLQLLTTTQRSKKRRGTQPIIQRAGNAQCHAPQRPARRQRDRQPRAGIERSESGYSCRGHLPGTGGNADKVGERELDDMWARREELVKERKGEGVRQQSEACERQRRFGEQLRVERGQSERIVRSARPSASWKEHVAAPPPPYPCAGG